MSNDNDEVSDYLIIDYKSMIKKEISPRIKIINTRIEIKLNSLPFSHFVIN